MRPLLALAALTAMVMGTVVLLPAEAQAAPVTKRLAVVVIQNGDTDNERTQLADTAYLRNIFFGTTGGTLTTWMPAVTHGLFNFTPAGDGVFVAQPNDALRTANPAGCHSDLAKTSAQEHMTSLGVAWDSLAVVYDIAACGWGGLGQMPGRITWYPPRPSLSAIVHEFGHNQGYPHQSKRDCAGGAISACKANDYSGNTPMGSGGSGKGYSSVELLHSGWVEPAWLQQTNKHGIFSLKPLYAPASVSGVRVVEFKATATLSYVIETRAQGTAIDTAVTNPGVRIYAVTNRDYKGAYMVNPGTQKYVPTGAVITDTANKLTISVRSSSASGATVAVEAIGAKPAPSPSVSSSSPTPSPSPEISEEPPPSPIENDIVTTADLPQPKSNGWIFAVVGVALALITFGGAAAVLRARARPRSRHRMR